MTKNVLQQSIDLLHSEDGESENQLFALFSSISQQVAKSEAPEEKIATSMLSPKITQKVNLPFDEESEKKRLKTVTISLECKMKQEELDPQGKNRFLSEQSLQDFTATAVQVENFSKKLKNMNKKHI
jgi:hypothetical protein